MRIAIIGAGGVGGYFGARWALAGEDVIFIARGQHLAAMQKEGLQVLSPNGDLHLKPAQATDDPGTVGTADLVIIATKLWSTDEAIATAQPMVGTASAVVSFQNGVDAIDKLLAAFGRERVLGGVANIAALIEQPGVIRHNGTMAMLQFGELDGRRTDRVLELEAACKRAGIDARIPNNISEAIWQKFVFLASLSAMTTLTRLPLGPLREDPDTRALFESLAEEVVDIARARGVKLADGTVEAMLERLDALPPDMVASMLGDLQRGNRLELPWLSGAVVKLGRELRVATPSHEFVVAALKLHAAGRHPSARPVS